MSSPGEASQTALPTCAFREPPLPLGKRRAARLLPGLPQYALAELPGPRLSFGFLGSAARFSSNVYFAKEKRSIGFRFGRHFREQL